MQFRAHHVRASALQSADSSTLQSIDTQSVYLGSVQETLQQSLLSCQLLTVCRKCQLVWSWSFLMEHLSCHSGAIAAGTVLGHTRRVLRGSQLMLWSAECPLHVLMPVIMDTCHTDGSADTIYNSSASIQLYHFYVCVRDCLAAWLPAGVGRHCQA